MVQIINLFKPPSQFLCCIILTPPTQHLCLEDAAMWCLTITKYSVCFYHGFPILWPENCGLQNGTTYRHHFNIS